MIIFNQNIRRMTCEFLGRRLNSNTLMWEYSDGSGRLITEEKRIRVLESIHSLSEFKISDKVYKGNNGLNVLAELHIS